MWYRVVIYFGGEEYEGLEATYTFNSTTGEIRDGDGALVPSRPIQGRKEPGTPTYASMIQTAVAKLNDRAGSSAAAIQKLVIQSYPQLASQVRRYIPGALKKLVAANTLTKHKHKYKLVGGKSSQCKPFQKQQPHKKKLVPDVLFNTMRSLEHTQAEVARKMAYIDRLEQSAAYDHKRF